MRIGILKCGQSPDITRDDHGDYDTMCERLLAGHGFTFDSYHVEAMQFPQDVHDADGWLITGSRHGVYENHPFIAPLEALIRRIHDAGVPLVGICFGHQIIAQALGGTVTKYIGGWAVGAQDYDFDGQPVTLNAWHQDQVIRKPEGATVAASNEFCENAALVYGDRAFTVQAHPEFGDGFVDALVQHRAPGVVAEPLLARARERRGSATEGSGVLGDRIAAFFQQPRGTAEPIGGEVQQDTV